jgi:hypothetical protein
MSGESSFSQKGEWVRKLDLMGGTAVKALQWATIPNYIDGCYPLRLKERKPKKGKGKGEGKGKQNQHRYWCELEFVGLIMFTIPSSRD